MKVPITEERDQPIPDSPPPSEPVTHKRRSHPLLVALLMVIIIALAGAAAILGYAYYFQKPTFPSNGINSPAPAGLTASGVLNDIKAVFSGKPASNPELSVPIKVAGYNYYTQVDPAQIKGLHDSVPYTDSALAAAKIAKVLKQKNFTETIVQAGNGESEYIANYTHSDVVCGVTAAKTANNPTGNHEVLVACANMSDYTSAAAAERPFYEAYPNKPSDNTTNILFIGHPILTPSRTLGYQTVSMQMGGVMSDGTPAQGGFTGLYYQTPDKTWHFFSSTQGNLPCSDYTNVDAKKAFVGSPCTDPAGKTSTVSL